MYLNQKNNWVVDLVVAKSCSFVSCFVFPPIKFLWITWPLISKDSSIISITKYIVDTETIIECVDLAQRPKLRIGSNGVGLQHFVKLVIHLTLEEKKVKHSRHRKRSVSGPHISAKDWRKWGTEVCNAREERKHTFFYSGRSMVMMQNSALCTTKNDEMIAEQSNWMKGECRGTQKMANSQWRAVGM